jgi:hypothetical protein
MGKTKNNHYLSQCISRNFIQNGSRTFWQYDCSTGGPLQPRNIEKLFAKRKIWSQEFENVLSQEWENKFAPLLKKYAECSVVRRRLPGKDGLSSFSLAYSFGNTPLREALSFSIASIASSTSLPIVASLARPRR